MGFGTCWAWPCGCNVPDCDFYDAFSSDSIGAGRYFLHDAAGAAQNFTVHDGRLFNEWTTLNGAASHDDRGAALVEWERGSYIGLRISVEAVLHGRDDYPKPGGGTTVYQNWGAALNFVTASGSGYAQISRFNNGGSTTGISWSHFDSPFFHTETASAADQDTPVKVKVQMECKNSAGTEWDIHGWIDDALTFETLGQTIPTGIPDPFYIGAYSNSGVDVAGGSWDDLCINVDHLCVTPEDSQIVADVTVTPQPSGTPFTDSETMLPDGDEFEVSGSAVGPCGTINYSLRLYCEPNDGDARYLLDVTGLETGITHTLEVTVTGMDPFVGTASSDEFVICGTPCLVEFELTGS